MAQLSQAAYDKLLKDAAAKGISVAQVEETAKAKGITLPTVKTPTVNVSNNPEIQKTNTETGGTKTVTTKTPTVTAVDSSILKPTGSTSYTAPNGKTYTIYDNGTQRWFDGGFGTKSNFKSLTEAKTEINAQNPAGTISSSGTGASATTAQIKNIGDQLKVDAASLKAEGLAGQKTLEEKLSAIDPADIKARTATIIDTQFQAAKDALTAASDLAAESEKIYGEGQIQAQASDMVKRGLNPAKASQAALFLNMKGRANLSAKIKTIESEFQKQISNLEMQKAELLIKAETSEVENQKYLIDQAAAIETNVQNLKTTYQNSVASLTENYILKPLLDMNSTNLAAEAQNTAAEIQKKYDVSTPERMVASLQRILGDNFAYVPTNVYAYTNLPYEQFVLKVLEAVRATMKANKVTA